MPRALDPAKLCPLGRRLVALAAAKGHPTLRAAATASGLDYKQLLDTAKGRFRPRYDTLQKIVAALGGTMADVAD